MVILKNNKNENETHSLQIDGPAFECFDEGCNLNLEGLKNKGNIIVNNKGTHYINFEFKDNKPVPYVTFNGQSGNDDLEKNQDDNLKQFKLVSGYIVNNEIDTNKYIDNIENEKYKSMLQLLFENPNKQKLNLLIPIINRINDNKFIKTLYELTLKYKESDNNDGHKEVSIYDILPKVNDTKDGDKNVEKSFFFRPIDKNNILIVFDKPIYVNITSKFSELQSIPNTPQGMPDTHPWFYKKHVKNDENGDRKMLINVDNLLTLLNMHDKEKIDKTLDDIENNKNPNEDKKNKEHFTEHFKESDYFKSEGSDYLSLFLYVIWFFIIITLLCYDSEKGVMICIIFNFLICRRLYTVGTDTWDIVRLILYLVGNLFLVFMLIYNFIKTTESNKSKFLLGLFIFSFLTFNDNFIDIIIKDISLDVEEKVFNWVNVFRLISQFISNVLFIYVFFHAKKLDIYWFKILIILYLFNNLLLVMKDYEFDTTQSSDNDNDNDNNRSNQICFIISLIVSVIVYYAIHTDNITEINLFDYTPNGITSSQSAQLQPNQTSKKERARGSSSSGISSSGNSSSGTASASASVNGNGSSGTTTRPTRTKQSKEIVSGSSFDEDRVYEKIADIIKEMREYDVNPHQNMNSSIREQHIRDISRLILPLKKSAAKKIVKQLGSEFKFDSDKGITINSNNSNNKEDIWDYLI